MEKTKNMFLTSAKELKTTSTLAVCAMLAALALILNSVASINIGPYVKIGFSSIPNQIADYLFGPITGCLFAGVLDIVKRKTNVSAENVIITPIVVGEADAK